VRQSFAEQIIDVVNLLAQQFHLAREAFDPKPSTASNFMQQPSGGTGTGAVDIDIIGREYGRCWARMQVSHRRR
jgi:hypothetical protein